MVHDKNSAQFQRALDEMYRTSRQIERAISIEDVCEAVGTVAGYCAALQQLEAVVAFVNALERKLGEIIDAQTERPELRTFTRDDPVAVLRRERPQYVTRVLTVL